MTKLFLIITICLVGFFSSFRVVYAIPSLNFITPVIQSILHVVSVIASLSLFIIVNFRDKIKFYWKKTVTNKMRIIGIGVAIIILTALASYFFHQFRLYLVAREANIKTMERIESKN